MGSARVGALGVAYAAYPRLSKRCGVQAHGIKSAHGAAEEFAARGDQHLPSVGAYAESVENRRKLRIDRAALIVSNESPAAVDERKVVSKRVRQRSTFVLGLITEQSQRNLYAASRAQTPDALTD